MERNPAQFVGLINTVNGTGAYNIFHNDTNQEWGVCKEGYNTAGSVSTAVALIGEPIPYGAAVKVEHNHSVVEVPQIVSIRGTETVVAGRQYKIIINAMKEKAEFGPKVGIYSVLAVDGETQATLMAKLKAKIDAHAGARVTTRSTLSMHFTAATDNNAAGTLAVGDILTQGTSGAVAKILAYTLATGTLASDDGAGTIEVVVLSGTWSASSLVSVGSGGGSLTTAVAGTAQTDEINLVDKGDYWGADFGDLAGVSAVQLIGFTGLTVAVSQTGVYSFGIGTRMLQDVPSWNLQKNNPLTGDAFFDVSVLPTAGARYTRLDIYYNQKLVNPNALDGYTQLSPRLISVWLKEDDAAGTVTNVNEVAAEAVTCAAIAAGGTR